MVIPEHRPEDELDDWHARDPIARFEGHLLREGIIEDSELHGLSDERLERIRRIATL